MCRLLSLIYKCVWVLTKCLLGAFWISTRRSLAAHSPLTRRSLAAHLAVRGALESIRDTCGIVFVALFVMGSVLLRVGCFCNIFGNTQTP